MCMWQESSAVSYSLWKAFSCPDTVLAIPQTQLKEYNTGSVTCHSCTGQRCENHVSLLGPTCNNHLTENLYKPQDTCFVFLFQPLLRPWEVDLVFILPFCWTYFEICFHSSVWSCPLKIISVSMLQTKQKVRIAQTYRTPFFKTFFFFMVLLCVARIISQYVRFVTKQFYLCTLTFSHSLHN